MGPSNWAAHRVLGGPAEHGHLELSKEDLCTMDFGTQISGVVGSRKYIGPYILAT